MKQLIAVLTVACLVTTSYAFVPPSAMPASPANLSHFLIVALAPAPEFSEVLPDIPSREHMNVLRDLGRASGDQTLWSRVSHPSVFRSFPPWTQTLLWKGDYAARRFSKRAYGDRSENAASTLEYPHVQSVNEEIDRLTLYLATYLEKNNSSMVSRDAFLERVARRRLGKPSAEDQAELLKELRFAYMDVEMRSTDNISRWNKAFVVIGGYLQIIRSRPQDGERLYAQVMQMLNALAAGLPLFDDQLASQDQPGQFVNFRSYVLDIEHGLAHSLDVLVDSLKVVDQTPPETLGHTLDDIQQILIGVSLFHDLTGLRDRQDHHFTARDLSIAILDAQRYPDGSRVYSRAMVDEIARGCQNHRGQKYPRPESAIEQIFLDVDEYNAIKGTRIFDMPGNGFFRPEFDDFWRDDSLREGPRLSDGRPRKHESVQADRFEYLLMTLIERTNPRYYKTKLVGEWASQTYDSLKSRILRLAKTLVQEEVNRDGLTRTQVKQRLYRMKGVIRELEALYRNDPQARTRLEHEIGTPEILDERVADLNARLVRDLELPVQEPEIRAALRVLRDNQVRRSTKRDNRNDTENPSPDFNVGLAIMDLYLENPFIPLDSLFERLHRLGMIVTPRSNGRPNLVAALTKLSSVPDNSVVKNSANSYRPVQMEWIYAGFADGLARTIAQRVRRLYEMSTPIGAPVPDSGAAPLALGYNAAEVFLHRLDQAETPNHILTAFRHEMDSLRYGPKRAENWDADEQDSPALEAMIRFRLRKAANLHVHPAGALYVEIMAGFYRRHPKLVLPFHEKYPDIDPRDPTALRQLLYGQEIDSIESFEGAFDIGHVVLHNDPDGRYHREWFEKIVEEQARGGTKLVGVVSIFGQSTLQSGFKPGEVFEKRLKGAIDGLIDGEEKTGTLGRALLGIRKNLSPEDALAVVRHWVDLRNHYKISHPKYASRMLGVDSVGHEQNFAWRDHAAAFRLARQEGFWVKTHVGEFWEPGQLKSALLRVEEVVDSHVVHQITNTMSLFVDISTSSLYAPAEVADIERIQERIIRKLIDRKMWVEVSPSSNHRISRRSRRVEGWFFRRLDPLIQRDLLLVITDDDPGLFETDLPLEFMQLYLGWLAYGDIGYSALKKLLKNSEILATHIEQYHEKRSSVVSPRSSTLLPAIGFFAISALSGWSPFLDQRLSNVWPSEHRPMRETSVRWVRLAA